MFHPVELKASLQSMIIPLCDAVTASDFAIKSYGVEHLFSRTNDDDLLNTVFSSWLDDVCGKANTASHNNTHLAITRHNAPAALHSATKWLKENQFSNDLTTLCHLVLSAYPFEKLAAFLSAEIDTIQRRAYIDAADRIVNSFWLSADNQMNRKPLQVPMSRGRYVLQKPHYGDIWNRQSSSRAFWKLTKTLSSETGLNGLENAALAILEAEDLAHSSSGIPSRSKFAAGNSVEVVYFKDCTKFFFDESEFFGLIGFLRSYSTKKLVELKSSGKPS